MATMELTLKDGVHVLELTNNEGENKFNTSVLNEYLDAFDQVEAYEGDTALLLTCKDEKTFSTGIDLEWLLSQSKAVYADYIVRMEAVFYRMAVLNAPTVACINGNAYGAGSVLATGADFRVMREDRGRFCYPEVNIKAPFSPAMIDIINLIPNKHALMHLALQGTAFGGPECLERQVVDAVYPKASLQEEAFAYAAQLAKKDRATYGTIKSMLKAQLDKYKPTHYFGSSHDFGGIAG